MNTERNKLLTKHVLGECWHEVVNITPTEVTCSCGKAAVMNPCKNRTFDNWQDFGDLWEAAQKKEWFDLFYDDALCEYEDGDMYAFHIFIPSYINPDRFSNAVYEFLKKES